MALNSNFLQWRHSTQASKTTVHPKEGSYQFALHPHTNTSHFVFSSQAQVFLSQAGRKEKQITAALVRVNLTSLFYSWVHDWWLEGKSTCTSLFAACTSPWLSERATQRLEALLLSGLDQASHDFIWVEAFCSPTICLKVRVDRGQQTMVQRAPNGNTLIKTKCLCFLLFSHAEDLAIHGCFCLHCWSTPFLFFSWAEPEGMLGYHPENSSWTLTKTIFWYWYIQTHLSSRYCCTTELAGCQLQPWNPRVVTKKLIKRVPFSTGMKAHGEPVVSTMASHSIGLSERAWRPFRPELDQAAITNLNIQQI